METRPSAGGPAPRPGRVVVALAVIVDDGGRVLVCRRRAGEHLGGLWEFPGGKVRDGERPDEAARRELAEETGLALPADVFTPLTFVQHDYPDRSVLLVAFHARLEGSGDGARAGRSRGGRWVGAEELAGLEMPAANGRITSLLEPLLRRAAGGPAPGSAR